jgi:AcrR family transcriptional regulator
LAEKGEGTRARILDEAVRLASRDGLEGLSIGVLATALDLSKSGLFAHFGSKQALQIAVLEHAAQRIRERTAPARDLPAGPERLRFLLEVSLDWIDDPERPGGCPITGACFEFDDRDGSVRQALLRLQRAAQERSVETFDGFAHPSHDRGQLAFEYRAITLAYHHASRVLREDRARAWARNALESLIAKALSPV